MVGYTLEPIGWWDIPWSQSDGGIYLGANRMVGYTGMRIFSGSAKSRGCCLTRTDLVNRPDPLRYFWTNIGGWGSLFPMINSSESAYFVA